MKIDLHVHASERSGCSGATEEQLIAAAKAIGLDGLCFTDHHQLVPAWHLAELNEKHAPFRIFGGIELTLAEEEDILVFGIDDPQVESLYWHFPDLHEFVRERDGFMALAHPFRYHPSVGLDLGQYAIDAIEIRSINIPHSDVSAIQEIADRFGLRTLANSDAHSVECVGMFHNALERAPADTTDLLHLLRSGAFTHGESTSELFELVDEKGRPIGMATREECHGNPELIHQVVHVLVLDAEGRLFLQKRAMNKDIQPGKWDTSVGGHMRPGEDPESAAYREMEEELSIRPNDLRFSHEYLWQSEMESELVRTYTATWNGPVRVQEEEIDEGRFWTFEEIRGNLGKGVFTPNFEVEFEKLQE